ncbi:MAG: hypothetical protein WCF67_12260 [Chitinophagaceae bacterium]
MKTLTENNNATPGFFFNLDMAEQVLAGNYTPTTKVDNGNWKALVGPETTDNFGNRLIPGRTYIPVVLTVSAASEEHLPEYRNAMSNIEGTKEFKYNLS